MSRQSNSNIYKKTKHKYISFKKMNLRIRETNCLSLANIDLHFLKFFEIIINSYEVMRNNTDRSSLFNHLPIEIHMSCF